MSIQTFAVFLSLFFLITGCGGAASTELESEPSQEQATRSPQYRDSIRQIYQQLLAARKDTLPLRQIREAGKLYPVDEAPKDTAFFIFREQLLRAVQRHDLFPLMDVIHPDIKVEFAGASGVADFVSTWKLDSPDKAEKSRVWEVLEKILKNGGTFRDGGKVFVAPYIFSTWPPDFDPFEYVAVTGAGVRLRSAPNLQSQTLTMVSNELVKRLEITPVEETIGGETHPWVKIQLQDETEGYVYGKYVASPLAYRAAFERQSDGKWLMIFLVADD